MLLLAIEFAIKATLIALGTGAVLRILHVRTAAARHAAWASVVVVMLLLPVWTVRGPKFALHWLPPLAEPAANHATGSAATLAPVVEFGDSTLVPRNPAWSWPAGLLGIYLAGAAVFLARLTWGTLQVQSVVRRASHRDGILFSGACRAPVTVGWVRPVVVLPESWPEWPAAQLEAVLTHEHAHARRRDPLFQWLALLNRAVFWFHPLAWWLERRIAALAEEACDAVVLAQGHDPGDYSRYLIEMARSVAAGGARIQVWGMTMPGGFLEQRIRRILEGNPLPQLSRARMVCACVACAVTAAAFATSTLDRPRPARQPDRIAVPDHSARNPMLAQAQQQTAPGQPAPVVVADGPGVRVSGADRILHRYPVPYPAEARTKGIEGTVILDVVLAPDGTVSDAAAISGPMELRQAVLSSVLRWHFSRGAASRQQVSVEFTLPREKAAASPLIQLLDPPPAPDAGSPAQEVANPRILKQIVIQRLSEAATEDLPGRLPVQLGQRLDDESLRRVRQAVRDFDQNLTVMVVLIGMDGIGLIVAPTPGATVKAEHAPPAASSESLSDVPRRLHVDIQGLSDEAAAELRRRLALREGEISDHAAFVKELERIHQIVGEFDPHLNDKRMTGRAARKLGPDGKPIPPDVMDATLIISPQDTVPARGLQPFGKVAKAQPNQLENVPIKLHVDIQGLSPEATAELRRRLAVHEEETTDFEALKKTAARIRQVSKEFDPRLTDEMHFDFPPRQLGADGKPIPWDSVKATMVIRVRY